MLNTLYARLAFSFFCVVTMLGAVLLWVGQYISDMYSQEVTQRLNSSIAMYVTEQEQLINNGVVNAEAMDKLANRVMTINPTVEVYLLDPRGRILTHLLPPEAVSTTAVSLSPIRTFLTGDNSFPLFGDDPRRAGSNKVFSVAPITEGGQITGYLYAVLGGEKFESLKEAVSESYILRFGVAAIIGILLVTLITAFTIFFVLTRRLSRLQVEVEAFQAAGPAEATSISRPPVLRDEVDELGAAFHQMSHHIQQQFKSLQSLDATRRELIANVSHDLRTPLASMQGYIETLLIRDDRLSAAQRKDYLNIALKHASRLNGLIGDLFELAKLDAGAVEPKLETFSLLELIHDCVQDFSLIAEQKHISLNINTRFSDCHVVADIALIQRVLQNLLDNAIHHTPAGNSVQIDLADHQDKVIIEVSDTGTGIATHEIPHIFERFYQSQQNQPSEKIGSGLGLAIVKRILDLHKSSIAVTSELKIGTRFTFDLPLVERSLQTI